MELLGKYMAKLLDGWDDKEFEEGYLRKIDKSEYLKMVEDKIEEENEKIRRRDWRMEHFSRGEILRGG